MVDWSCLNASYNNKWISKSESACLAANHSCKQVTAWVFYQHAFCKENKDNKKTRKGSHIYMYMYLQNLI